ncbi:MAG: hypothetical protein C0500_07550 [Sphingobium sp.]|nr:hypothetical protein [Sphingobium sp.]
MRRDPNPAGPARAAPLLSAALSVALSLGSAVALSLGVAAVLAVALSRVLGVILAVILSAPLAAQTPTPPVVISAAPDSVAVSVYRAPYRSAETPISRGEPQGFALITETRTVTIPAGRAVVRFEGVAGNIFPETAIVEGLPRGVREKNLDADLLSPRSLYDRALGRRVMVRRTNKATGKVTEEQAVIRSSADGAALVSIDGGVEALKCTGLNETIVYPDVPPGLSAKPTLSIETESDRPVTVKITLAYLAGGFDWQADYVVQLAPDRRSAELFAWVTLASSDPTSFRGGAAVIAGRVNRDADSPTPPTARPLTLRCFPVPPPLAERGAESYAFVPPPPPPPAPPPPMMAMARSAEAQDVVVTGALAKREDLADLKLYRLNGPVTVASRAQKQVGFLAKPRVTVALIHESRVYQGDVSQTQLIVRAQNKAIAGLGEPLPAGHAVVLAANGARPILIGESSTADKAVGEQVEFKLGPSPNVRVSTKPIPVTPRDGRRNRYRLTVTNANAWPVQYEARIEPGGDSYRLEAPSARLTTKDGKPFWSVTVPANGSASLDYTIRAVY